MTREEAIAFVKGLRGQGKTYTEIAKALPASWKGSREPGTIQRWLVKPPSDMLKILSTARAKSKSKSTKIIIRRKKPQAIPVAESGKVLIMMCSMQQAKELLG